VSRHLRQAATTLAAISGDSSEREFEGFENADNVKANRNEYNIDNIINFKK